VSLEGYPFRLVDTAGLREEAGRIEGLGIEVARSYLDRADLVLLCVEAGRELGADEVEFVKRYGGESLIVLRTKADLVCRGESDRADRRPEDVTVAGWIPLSVRTGAGVADLRERLLQAVYAGLRGAGDAPLVTRGRQIRCLRAAVRHMEEFRRTRAEGLPAEIAATHAQDATLALEDLLGVVTTEELLDAVFAEFCVGK
jgi:tRNA modification GTPase